MKTKIFPMLYKKNSAGTKILTHQVEIMQLPMITTNDTSKVISTTSDLSGGKEKVSEKVIKAQKNKSSFERAVALQTTQFHNRVRLGYYDSEEGASRASIPLTAMLAATLPPEEIMNISQGDFPIYMQEKKNGLRGTYHAKINTIMSRSLKPFGKFNNLLTELKNLCEECNLDYLDFELYAQGYKINEQVSMVRHGDDRIKAIIFDIPIVNETTWVNRLSILESIKKVIAKKPRQYPHIEILSTYLAKQPKDIISFYNEKIEKHAEGIMLRYPDGMYRWNNKNSRGDELIKIKPLLSDEFKIVGCGKEERIINKEKVWLINFLCETHDGTETFVVTPASFGVELRKEMWMDFFSHKKKFIKNLPPLSLTFREWTSKLKPFHIKDCYLRDMM